MVNSLLDRCDLQNACCTGDLPPDNVLAITPHLDSSMTFGQLPPQTKLILFPLNEQEQWEACVCIGTAHPHLFDFDIDACLLEQALRCGCDE